MGSSTGEPGPAGAASPSGPARPLGPNAPPPPPQPTDATPWRPWHNEDLAWAAAAHLGGIVLWVVAPLVVYWFKRHDSGFLRDQAAEAMNFQLSLLVQFAGATLMLGVAAQFLPPLPTVLLFAAYFLAVLFSMVYVPVEAIRAALAAGRGEVFRYPATIRLVK